jgi:U3 small nucleolar RNA-associated protein MPP10
VREFLKRLYDFIKSAENGLPFGDALPELIIQGFDEEQIWQELELQNEGRSKSLVAGVASVMAWEDLPRFPVQLNSRDRDSKDVNSEERDSRDVNSEERDSKDVKSEERDSRDVNSEDDWKLWIDEVDGSFTSASENKEDDMEPAFRKWEVPYHPSAVDDRFFKMSEMEHFLQYEDKRETGQHTSSDESIDFFQPTDDGTGEVEDLHYDDFFDAPNEDGQDQAVQLESETEWGGVEEEEGDRGVSDGLSYEEDTPVNFRLDETGISKENGATGTKSSLEMRQERLRMRLNQLEEQALAEKPWQQKGEVSASTRPHNSLLEEMVEFDLTTRAAPIITERTTLQLEDIIRQRVKDRAWDDVERKVKPIETPNEYKKKLVLDQEKSKLSLSQVYEQEYIKQRETQEAAGDVGHPQEEPPEHHVVRAMMASLFSMLDALSNFHFTPKPPAPEVKIVSNLPAITLEEVAPVATSDAALLAPEEVKERPKGDVIGKEERTSSDKKRERRHKKLRQREKQHEREKREQAIEKLQPGLGNKYSKEKAMRDLEKVTKSSNITQVVEKANAKSVRSSRAFFNSLQEEVKSHIRRKASGGIPDQQKNVRSAKKLKL